MLENKDSKIWAVLYTHFKLHPSVYGEIVAVISRNGNRITVHYGSVMQYIFTLEDLSFQRRKKVIVACAISSALWILFGGKVR